MDRTLPKNIKWISKSGLRIDCISRIIAEHWPDAWQASVDRQNRELEKRHNLLRIAHQQLQKKVS